MLHANRCSDQQQSLAYSKNWTVVPVYPADEEDTVRVIVRRDRVRLSERDAPTMAVRKGHKQSSATRRMGKRGDAQGWCWLLESQGERRG